MPALVAGRVRRGSAAAGGRARVELERADSETARRRGADHVAGSREGRSGPDSTRPAGLASPTARRAVRGRPRDRDPARRRRPPVVRAQLAGQAERAAGLGAGRAPRPAHRREPDRGARRRAPDLRAPDRGQPPVGQRRRGGWQAGRRDAARPRLLRARSVRPSRPVLRPVRAGDQRLLEAERLAGRRVWRASTARTSHSCSARPCHTAACACRIPSRALSSGWRRSGRRSTCCRSRSLSR